MVEEEKLVLQFQNVKHKKQNGVLLFTSLRVAWAPGEIVQTFQADFPYQQIKGITLMRCTCGGVWSDSIVSTAQRISSEASSKVQLQLILHTGVHVKFHFSGINALEQRQQV